MDKYYKPIVNFLKHADPNKMIRGEYLECATRVPPYNTTEKSIRFKFKSEPTKLPYVMEII